MRILVIALAALVSLYILYEAARVLYLFHTGVQLAKQAQPFSRAEGTFSVLVLGDSTAVGVGASDAASTTAGKLSEYLNASIENRAVSGAITSDIPKQIAGAKKEIYDLVLIQVGANDVIRRHPVVDTAEQLKDVLSLAHKRSSRVVLLTAGDIGDAPIFPRLLAPIVSERSGEMRRAFMARAEESGAAYVDLMAAKKFQGTKGEFYARDGLHLSNAGYGFWFEEIRKTILSKWPELAR